jgi:hypothetical protein
MIWAPPFQYLGEPEAMGRLSLEFGPGPMSIVVSWFELPALWFSCAVKFTMDTLIFNSGTSLEGTDQGHWIAKQSSQQGRLRHLAESDSNNSNLLKIMDILR